MPHATHPVTVRTRWLTIGEGGHVVATAKHCFFPNYGGGGHRQRTEVVSKRSSEAFTRLAYRP